MIKEILELDHCLTVKELKEILKDWPETRADGTPTEVWLSNAASISNEAIEISTLNLDSDDTADIVISHGW